VPEERATGTAYLLGDAVGGDLRADVAALAADEMEGREAATRGEERAARYIADRLHEMGLQPAAENGGGLDFLQEFDVQIVRFDTSATRISLHDHPLGRLRLGADWISMPEFSPIIGLDSVDVVFSGFGITALEHGYDDYASIDAAGKVVVALGGAPATLDSVSAFGQTFAASDLITKWISAAIQGAAALLVVDFEPAIKDWNDFATLARGSSATLASEKDAGVPIMPYAFLSRRVGNSLIASFADTAGGVTPGPTETNFRMALHLTPQRESGRSRNVVARLPGAVAPEEYVAIGAHLDHLGRGEQGIYNGADDDASGVAAVLAVARAFTQDAAAGRTPDRSLLFVFHGAEEKGLLGAEFFTSSPERSVLNGLNQIVAKINLDMVGRESVDSLYVVGADRMSSTLAKIVIEANRQLGPNGQPLFVLDRAFDDPDDPERTFERSDHFKYAVRGIPVVFLTDGMGMNWAKGTELDDYHEVTDDPEKLDFEKVRRVASLAYEISRRAAASDAHIAVDGEIPVENP